MQVSDKVESVVVVVEVSLSKTSFLFPFKRGSNFVPSPLAPQVWAPLISFPFFLIAVPTISCFRKNLFDGPPGGKYSVGVGRWKAH